MNKNKVQKQFFNLDFFYLTLLLTLVGLYLVFFWGVPLSEDSGYYAFLSKAVSSGVVLHNDIPVTTNSFFIYVIALVFKLFGFSSDAYRAVHAIGYTLFVLIIYSLVNTFRSHHEAFFATLLCAVLVVVPHVMLDLGRNQIIWCLAFIFYGLYCKLYWKQSLLYGFCLSLAAITRETFLIVSVAYFITEVFSILLLQDESIKKTAYDELKKFCVGVIGGLLINALLLTYYGCWSAYLNDMLGAGQTFRYSRGFFSFGRIKSNLHALSYGFNHYYQPIILFAIASYFLKTKNIFINQLKRFFLPIFVIEALLINRTISYSVVPVLVVCSILTVYFWSEMFKLVRIKYLTGLKFESLSINRGNKVLYLKSPMKIILILAGLIVLLFYSVIRVPYYVSNIHGQFYDYLSCGIIARESTAPNNWTTERLLKVIPYFPSARIATFAMFPLLFEMKNSTFYSYPYLFDLSMPANYRSERLKLDQENALLNQEADLVILKGTHKDSTQTRFYINSIFKNYLTVLDYGFSTEAMVRSYLNRVFISKKYFYKHYIPKYHFAVDDAFAKKVTNNTNAGMIMQLRAASKECISGFTLVGEQSKVEYSERDNNGLSLYAFLLPGETVRIVQPMGNNQNVCKLSGLLLYRKYS